MTVPSIQIARADEGSEAAANILQHLSTILSEERDKKLPPETRLLRMLLRTKRQEERLGMLLEKLLLANPPPRPTRKDEETGEEVEEERFWGEPEVRAFFFGIGDGVCGHGIHN